jgi:hypothetical protein
MFSQLIKYVDERFAQIQKRMDDIANSGRVEGDDYMSLVARQGELIALRNMIENLIEEVETNTKFVVEQAKLLALKKLSEQND